jgi:hypothetical protein
MIVITSRKGANQLEKYARQVADELRAIYVPRAERSLADIFQQTGEDMLLQVSYVGLRLYVADQPDKPFFFHPSSAMFRAKRLLRQEHDPFLQATGLRHGMHMLDATLGLASDALIAALAVGGRGRVVGLEAVPILAYIVQHGLQSWQSGIEALDAAMRSIEVQACDHTAYLQACPDHAFDVVYFDPMFEATVEGAAGIAALKRLADYQPLTEEAVQEAKRVARKRVVLKDSSFSSRFARLGFQPLNYHRSSHWYGVIELG